MFNSLDFIHENIGLCLGEVIEKAYEQGKKDASKNENEDPEITCPICGRKTEEREDGKGGKICFTCLNKARGYKE